MQTLSLVVQACATSFALIPIFVLKDSDYCDSSSGQFLQQLPHRGRHFSITRHDHSPFQIFPERSRDDAPALQRRRHRPADLDDAPLAGQRQCCHSVGPRAGHDEMVLPTNQDADHGMSGVQPRVGNGAADGKMINDLARKLARILAPRSIIILLLELSRAGRMFLAGL